MKLLQRNQIYDNRIAQSFGQIGVNKGKILATTRNSFSRTDHKLPQLNRSYSYSNAKNSKQKLVQLDQRVLQLANKVNDLRLQTRQSRRFTNFLKEDLGQRELNDNKHKILTKLNMLDKFSKLIRQNNEQRTQFIKNDCQKLHNSSIQLQNLMFNLSQCTDRLQNAMGIYSGKQKHKV